LSKLPEALEAELFGDEKKTEEAGEPVTETINSAETSVVGEPNEIERSDNGNIRLDTKTVSGDQASAGAEVECPYTPRQISKGIKLAGNKSPCWKWRHLG
jgi:hypothetical protein